MRDRSARRTGGDRNPGAAGQQYPLLRNLEIKLRKGAWVRALGCERAAEAARAASTGRSQAGVRSPEVPSVAVGSQPSRAIPIFPRITPFSCIYAIATAILRTSRRSFEQLGAGSPREHPGRDLLLRLRARRDGAAAVEFVERNLVVEHSQQTAHVLRQGPGPCCAAGAPPSGVGSRGAGSDRPTHGAR